VSFPNILKIRPLVSAIGIRNVPEEAHYEGGAEGQCPAAPLSPTRWAGAAGERREDGAGTELGWGMSRLEGSGICALVARV